MRRRKPLPALSGDALESRPAIQNPNVYILPAQKRRKIYEKLLDRSPSGPPQLPVYLESPEKVLRKPKSKPSIPGKGKSKKKKSKASPITKSINNFVSPRSPGSTTSG